MKPFEEYRDALENLSKWFEENEKDRNEATTRFQLIDRLLLECLGWEHADISCEDSHGGKYSDYTLKLLRPIAIIEAKKEGVSFEIPSGFEVKTIHPIRSIIKNNKKIADALEQVSDYCQKRGIEVGVVSNGWQLIIFLANRTDSVPPLEGNCLVFPSISFMLENFLELWNAISKPGLEALKIKKILLGDELPELPSKVSSTIKNYPGIKNRNPFQTDMQIISDVVLEDIVKERDVETNFLKECYCKSGALSQYALVSKEILKSRYQYLFEEGESTVNLESAVTKKGISDEFKQMIANSLSRRPILLVGDVGVGKTSFIRNLIKVEADQIFDNALSFVIDLGSKAVITEDIQKTIIEEISYQLINEYGTDIYEDGFVRGTYHKELQSFRKGIYKRLFDSGDSRAIEKEIEFLEQKIQDTAKHIQQSLDHLSKGRKKQIIIFIDNCDQRDDNTQQTAFLIAQEIADNWAATVFVTLRPETFHRSISSGSLSGYHPKAFTIAPPRVSDVIEKRLEFAQKITRGQIPIKSLQLSLTFNKLDELIDVITMSIQHNYEIYEFIDNISNGNIRQAIDILKAFVGSGHIDTEKIIHIYENSGRYFIPIHEFMRAIIYGDSRFYDPNTSRIVNIFDVHHHDEKEHFLMPIILAVLNHQVESGKKEGFLEVSKIYDHLQSLGFVIEQIDLSINILYSKNLIESSQKGRALNGENLPSLLRLTTLGAYHLNNLTKSFVYYDAVVLDTPIFNTAIRDLINANERIEDRLERGRVFLNYLEEKGKIFEKEKTFFNLQNCIDQSRKRIDEIAERVSRDKIQNEGK